MNSGAMDIVGPIYRLEHEHDTRTLHGRDWDMDEANGLVFYKPAKLLFTILTDDENASTPVPIMSLVATPVHYCDGTAPATPGEMKQIAKDAIHWFYLFADACMREPIRPDPAFQLGPDDALPF